MTRNQSRTYLRFRDVAQTGISPLLAMILIFAFAGTAVAGADSRGFGDSGWSNGLADFRPSDRRNTNIAYEGVFDTGLHVTIPAGAFRGLGPFHRLPSSSDEAWFRYHIKLLDFEAHSSGKLPGLSGLYSSTARGCKPSRPGAPGWSARGLFGAEGTRGAPNGEIPIGTYLYHVDQPRPCGESSFWPNSSLRPGQWHCVEGYVGMNQPGKKDGSVMGWLDGTRRYTREGLRFRRSNEEQVSIKEMWLDIYYGGKQPAPSSMNLLIDELAVSTQGRIGCLDQATSVVGAFDGSSEGIATYEPRSGSWLLNQPVGKNFSSVTRGKFHAADGWNVHVVGDFTGNGRDDIANFHSRTGNWVVVNPANERLGDQVWKRFETTVGWDDHLAGDFTGNGQSEIASFHSPTGRWLVSTPGTSVKMADPWPAAAWSRPQSLSTIASQVRSEIMATPEPMNDRMDTKRWAEFETTKGWSDRLVGDFDGDGKDDIANYHPGSGNWVIARSTGESFETAVWSQFGTRSGWSNPLVGDFDGDGKDDVANYHRGSGNWVVARSSGSAFINTVWGTFETKAGWASHVVGDFDGDDLDDIASYHVGTGNWVVSRSNGRTLEQSVWSTFATRSGWTSQSVGDFDGDGYDDIASYHLGSQKWIVTRSTGREFRAASWSDRA